MNITLSTTKLTEVDAPLLASLIPEDVKQLSGQLAELDGLLGGGVSKALSSEAFKGRLYTSFLLYTANKI